MWCWWLILYFDEWKGDFVAFKDWSLSNGYSKDLQIDRKNNDGNYTPSNCRFITGKENCRNRRSTKLTMEDALRIRSMYKYGEYFHRELADIFGVSSSAVWSILNNKTWL